MKFDWVFLKVIHFDINSDVNSLPFIHVISQAPSAGTTATSYKFGEVWLSITKVIIEIGVKFDWVFLKDIHFDVNSDVNS